MFDKVYRRLLLNNVLVFALVLLAFAVLVYGLFANNAFSALDSRVKFIAESMAVSINELREKKQDSIEDRLRKRAREEGLDGERAGVVQWLNPAGQSLFSYGSISDAASSGVRAHRVPIYQDGKSILGYVQVGLSTNRQSEDVRLLAWVLGGSIPMLLIAVGLASRWLTKQAMQPVLQSFERLRQFTADASHELRSPVTAINVNSSMALRHLDKLDQSEIQEAFSKIEGSSQHMAKIIDDLLFLARMDAATGARSRNQELVDLDAVLRHLVSGFEPIAHAKGIQITYESVPNVAIEGETTQLTHLFKNLVDNAINYTPGPGAISVVLTNRKDCVQVAVADSGIGIEAGSMRHIFERFWREERARSVHKKGTGLGLALVQAYTVAHGGQVSVKSRENEGTTFTVTLPK